MDDAHHTNVTLRAAMVGVAQLVEHWIVIPGVASSSLVAYPTKCSQRHATCSPYGV